MQYYRSPMKNQKNSEEEKEIIRYGRYKKIHKKQIMQTLFTTSSVKKRNLKNENTSFIDLKNIEKLFLNKFGDKSEIIDYENMKKIKAILSNNNAIKDEIIYPNEIYK